MRLTQTQQRHRERHTHTKNLRAVLENFRVDGSDSVGRVTSHNAQVRHVHLLLGSLLDQRHVTQAIAISRPFLRHFLRSGKHFQNRTQPSTRTAVFMSVKMSKMSKFFGAIAISNELRPKCRTFWTLNVNVHSDKHFVRSSYDVL